MNTPYDLRVKMLEMAKDYLDRQFEIGSAAYMTMLRQAQDTNKALNKEFLDSVPKMYDTSAIMDLADKFNVFVSKK